MKKIDCKQLKLEELEELKRQIDDKNIGLRIIQVEGDSASDVYVRNKMKAGRDIGLDIKHILLDQTFETEQIINIINVLNDDDSINGIMVQLPLPKHLDEQKIINAIKPEKDVDGLTYENLGRIISKEEGLRPCTAEGVIDILDKSIGLNNLEGKQITIIGRSKLVGLPLYHMLLEYNATPVICHTKTKNLENYTQNADIIVTAAGANKPFINKEMIKEGSIIIDVSTVKGEDGKLHGDVVYDDVVDKAAFVTPVPGGVGQLTVLELMKNTYKAYNLQKQRNHKKEKTYTKRAN